MILIPYIYPTIMTNVNGSSTVGMSVTAEEMSATVEEMSVTVEGTFTTMETLIKSPRRKMNVNVTCHIFLYLRCQICKKFMTSVTISSTSQFHVTEPHVAY